MMFLFRAIQEDLPRARYKRFGFSNLRVEQNLGPFAVNTLSSQSVLRSVFPGYTREVLTLFLPWMALALLPQSPPPQPALEKRSCLSPRSVFLTCKCILGRKACSLASTLSSGAFQSNLLTGDPPPKSWCLPYFSPQHTL